MFSNKTLFIALALLTSAVFAAHADGPRTQRSEPPKTNRGQEMPGAKKPLAAADTTPDPTALVKQLGSEDYAEREIASMKLRKLGATAEAALKAGLKSEDLEVRTRAIRVLALIRNDLLAALVKTFDPKAEAESDHPVWKRYKNIAGSDPAARQLFAEIIADPRRLTILDVAETNPDNVGELYEREIERLAQKTRAELARQMQTALARQMQAGRGDGELPAHLFGPDDPTPTPADVAVGFYLGTFPATAKTFADPRWENIAVPGSSSAEHDALFHNPNRWGLDLLDVTPGRRAGASTFRRLFAAWLAQRREPGSICLGLEQARLGRVVETLPTARAVAGDVKKPVRVRAAALPILGAFGEAKDEPLVVALLDDKNYYTETKYGPEGKDAKVQLRDLALGALLVLRGKSPEDFGFPAFPAHAPSKLREIPLYPHYLGFHDDTSRNVTHKLARAWLNQPPAEKLKAVLTEHEAACNQKDYEALCEAYVKADRDRRKTLKGQIDKARETFRQQTEKCVAGCLKLAQTYAADPAALDALLWVVGHTATGAPALPQNAALVQARGRALDLLLRDHLRSERLSAVCRLCGMGIMQDPESVKFLEEVLARELEKLVREAEADR